MGMYPVFLKLQNRTCLVAGGGTIAERKINSLLKDGARVRVVTLKCTERITTLAADGVIKCELRPFREKDLDGVFLVIAATDSRSVNREIYRAAEDRNILINAADEPENCSFYVPARIRRGDLQLAVSTSGKVPYFARKLKEYLETILYDDLSLDLEELHRIRRDIIDSAVTHEEKQAVLKKRLDPKIHDMLKRIAGE